jgi:Domain of unknown function (DUF5615)
VISFLVDAQLPPALTKWVASAGHDCKHVADLNLATASDNAIWDYAARANLVIVTKTKISRNANPSRSAVRRLSGYDGQIRAGENCSPDLQPRFPTY